MSSSPLPSNSLVLLHQQAPQKLFLTTPVIISVPASSSALPNSSNPPQSSSGININQNQSCDFVKPFQTSMDKNGGRWTEAEHKLFLEAYEKYGKDWKKIQNYVGTRSSTQARSHAQKYFTKLKKAQQKATQQASLKLHAQQVLGAQNLGISQKLPKEDFDQHPTLASSQFISPMDPHKSQMTLENSKSGRFLTFDDEVDSVSEPPLKMKISQNISGCAFNADCNLRGSCNKPISRIPTACPLIEEEEKDNQNLENSVKQEPGFRDFNDGLFEPEPTKPQGITIIELNNEFPDLLGEENLESIHFGDLKTFN